IASATRTAPEQRLNMLAVASFSTPGSTDPAITSDGLHILYLNGNHQVYQSDRADRHAMWSAPTIVSGIDSFIAGGGLDISLDGLTIYVSDSSQLYTATRTDPMGRFGDLTKLAVGRKVSFPGVSPDERELFYNPENTKELRRMTRNDRSLDFDVMTD